MGILSYQTGRSSIEIISKMPLRISYLISKACDKDRPEKREFTVSEEN